MTSLVGRVAPATAPSAQPLFTSAVDGEWVLDIERTPSPRAINHSCEFSDELVSLGVRSIGQRTEVAADHDGFGEAIVAQSSCGLVSARVVVGQHDTARHGSRPFVPIVEDAHGAA